MDRGTGVVTAGELLGVAAGLRQDQLRAEAEILVAAVEWAILHPELDDQPATLWSWGEDTLITLAGDGAPGVDPACIAEFAAVLGITTEAGQRLIGDALELRFRLPMLWAGVQALRVPAWRARTVAEATRGLSRAGAGFVDRQVAAAAGRIGPTQLARLIATAVAIHGEPSGDGVADPDDGVGEADLFVQVECDTTSVDGRAHLTGTLELPDGLALAAGAQALTAWGSDAPLQARRARALGDLARRQPLLDPAPPEPAPDSASQNSTGPDPEAAGPAPRTLTIYAHLTVHHDTTVDCDTVAHHDTAGPFGPLGRLGTTNSPVTAEQVRHWCRAPGTRVIVKPVIDLNQPVSSERYQVPDRIREHVLLRDPTCVFPWCAKNSLRADIDHITPWPNGPTHTDNLAPLCRRHHRLKTHTGWTYHRNPDGSYTWTSPHGWTLTRDPSGTHPGQPPQSRPDLPPPGPDG
ncbi:HNH endonuclease signature motif containing protein [Naumannella huperziae]